MCVLNEKYASAYFLYIILREEYIERKAIIIQEGTG